MRRNGRDGPISRAIAAAGALSAPRPRRTGKCVPILSDVQSGGAELAARFKSSIQYVGDCHEWAGAFNPYGYGYFKIRGRQRFAHRVAWVLANGQEIPEYLFVCHSCDNRRCVNPDHLWIGSGRENMIDMYLKGRGHSTRSRGCRVIAAELLPDYQNHEVTFA